MINLFFFFSHFSFLEFPIPNNIAFIGEIGLGGELRAVSTYFHCNNQEARQNQLVFYFYSL
jgi:predicted ATP-dependent serine protease